MTPLPSQEFFESLIAKGVPHEHLVIVRFTASWCGPCQKVKDAALLEGRPDAEWYLCDIDENDYTAGYCGVKTIPCFQAIVDGVPKPLFQSSDTEKIVAWSQSL
jgi:thioredoxin-like negative regulator of GroEL